MSMAKIVDDAIGRLPESIQRELNDAWASGQSSPYTRVVDPLNATLLHRAQTIRGMQAEVAALKAQRDELLAGLERIANPIPYEQANVPEGYTLDGHALLAQVSKPLYYQTVARALIAKHKEASHG